MKKEFLPEDGQKVLDSLNFEELLNTRVANEEIGLEMRAKIKGLLEEIILKHRLNPVTATELLVYHGLTSLSAAREVEQFLKTALRSN